RRQRSAKRWASRSRCLSSRRPAWSSCCARATRYRGSTPALSEAMGQQEPLLIEPQTSLV
ncbi:hypothetical protein C7D73_30985, partial [Klebsiella pneumoniae]